MIFYEISGFGQSRCMQDLRSDHIHVQVHVQVAAKSIGTLLQI